MQTTQTIDFSTGRISCGYMGEHKAVELSVTVPENMLDATHLYRLAFEIGDLSARSTALTAVDGKVSYAIPLSVAAYQVVPMQLEEYASDESLIRKSPIVLLQFAHSVPNGTAGVDNDAGVMAEITANTAAIERLDIDVLEDITAAPPQIVNKYYANDGVSGAVLMDGITTAQFGAVSDFIPDTAKIIDVSIRYTLDGGTTVSDVPIFGGYCYSGNNGSVPFPLLNGTYDIFSFGNNTQTFTVNDASIRPYLRVTTTRSANAGSIVKNPSSDYILGFTVTYIM